jgi:hypothetical protein
MKPGPHDVGVTHGGPKSPRTTRRPRATRSVRRTATIDSIRPDGLAGDVVVHARARDLHTGALGNVTVIEDGFDAAISPARVLVAIEHPDPRLVGLLGQSVAGGFRGRAAALVPDHAATASLLNLLLDDLPGASLVAGYAGQRDPSWSNVHIPIDHVARSIDLCAGWADDATILGAVRSAGTIPVPTIAPVVAPVDERSDDAAEWHERPPLPNGAMRRARRLDLVDDGAADGSLAFDAHFRDSYLDADDGEGSLHEYSVRGRFDPEDRTIRSIDGAAHVLPWQECPAAIGSVGRVVGMPADDLRARVRAELVGTSTCTHLNDLLRSLADLPVLASELEAGPTADGSDLE